MYPPLTLKDPAHETFAHALAKGLSPTAAYTLLGRTSNNAKARGTKLAKDPDIIHRVEYLRACLPRIHDFQARFAPSTLFIPETRAHMEAWLWQVATAARQPTNLQFRAVALLCRLKGWHLHPRTTTSASKPKHPHIPGHPQTHTASTPPPPDPSPIPSSADLSPEERTCLAAFIQQTIATEATFTAVPSGVEQAFHSTMADAYLTSLLQSASNLEDPTQDQDPTTLLSQLLTTLHPKADPSDPPDQTDPPDQSCAPQTPANPPENPTSIPAKSPPYTVNKEALYRNYPHLGIDLSKPPPWLAQPTPRTTATIPLPDCSPSTDHSVPCEAPREEKGPQPTDHSPPSTAHRPPASPPPPKPLRCRLLPPFREESLVRPPGTPKKRWTSR